MHTKSNNLDTYIKVRVNARDYQQLQRIKEETDLSVSDIVRQAIKPLLRWEVRWRTTRDMTPCHFIDGEW